MESDRQTIIIDNGSCFIKSGFSYEDSPKSCFRACVGYPPNKSSNYKDYYIGKEMKGQMSALNLKYPNKEGEIENWDDMEKIWEFIFKKELEVDPSKYNIILTQPLMNTEIEQSRMAQIMFENFHVPSLHLAYSVDLLLYSSYKETGLFIDLGASSTQITAVLFGYHLPYKYDRLYYGGKAITDYLFELLQQSSKMFYNDKNKFCVEDIKEKACYVALDYGYEYVEPYSYTLPDNKDLIIGRERIQATEALFNPGLIHRDGDLGLHQACNKILEKIDENKKDIYNCIYISGGNSLFKGLNKRLTEEIKAKAKESEKEEVRVISSNDGQLAVWMGGKILSEISSFEDVLITKERYEESGDSIVYRKHI